MTSMEKAAAGENELLSHQELVFLQKKKKRYSGEKYQQNDL